MYSRKAGRHGLQVQCTAYLVIPVAALDRNSNVASQDGGDKGGPQEDENAAADEPEGDVERVAVPQILP